MICGKIIIHIWLQKIKGVKDLLYQVLIRELESLNSFSYIYRDGYCEFTENRCKIYDSDKVIEKQADFDYWYDVLIESEDTVCKKDEQYIQLIFSNDIRGYITSTFVKENDVEEVKSIYLKRNSDRKYEKTQITSYIDDSILEIAENLINIIEENVMLNNRVVAWGYNKYYLGIIRPAYYIYQIFIDTDRIKGKQKKEAEAFNEELKIKFNELSKIIDNFVDIIIEEKNIKEDIAKSVAWEAIQQKTIEYYAQIWEEEYETNFENDYTELYERMAGKKISDIQKAYISQVILSDKMDIYYSQEMLIYFLISKVKYQEIDLALTLNQYYEMIKEVEDNIESEDIKNKLKTKQKRKISKYTINDVDLMTGTEFEEFIGLLFKKMGYTSRVTQQSGDQGLDVIAIKNGTKIGIQAKCYSNTVGNSAIQEAVAGKSFYNCDKLIVITNNYFTSSAIKLAQANNVILWNRDMLKEKIKELM